MDHVIEYLNDHQAEHLEWAKKLVRFQTVSTLTEHKQDLVDAANWLKSLCTDIGLVAEVHDTGGHPAVYAERITDEDKPTYLVYGHYDVQPVGNRDLWDADPFEPVITDEWMIARGAADNKGQVLIYLRAAAAWLATAKELPINLKVLIEGEEEIGSPNLATFIDEHKQLLACDHILISDTGMYEDGWPTITYGTRGLLYKEIRLAGPKHDLHSGSFGGTIANPAHVLADLIASLHDADGRVTIPGFYDDVIEASDDERRQLQSLPFDESAYLEDIGVPETVGERGYSTNERRWIRPTLDINGVFGGFMGNGANTIIPASAGAKVSMRLVPNQDAETLGALFDDAIRARCPDSVKLELIHHGHADAYMAPLDSAPMAAAIEALRDAFGRDVALIREGGSLPILPMFKKLLGVDSLMLGFASPQCNAHGPNEKVRLPDLNRGAEAIVRLWAR